MDPQAVQEFVCLLENLTHQEEETRNAAQQAFFELKASDPNNCINLLFTVIAGHTTSTARKQALIQAKNILLLETRKNAETRAIADESFQYIISCITQSIQKMNMDNTEWDFLFLIIYSLITPIILPGLWPDVFTIMWGLLSTDLCYRAILFFAEYLSFAKEEMLSALPGELLQNIPQLVKLDSDNSKIVAASINLAYKLILFNPEMITLYPVIQQALLNLPDSEINDATDAFISNFYMNIIDESLNDFFGVFLQIAVNAERSDQARIPALETITKFISRPSVNRFLSENIEIFVQTLTVCFLPNDREDGVYMAASNLLDVYIELNGTSLISQAIEAHIAEIPPQSISAFLAYIPSPKFAEMILQFAQEADETISQNSFDSLEKMLHDNYRQLKNKKPDAIPAILGILLQWIENGRIEAITPLAELVENFSYYDKPKLQEIIPTLLEIYTKCPTPDSVRCIAALVKAFPEEMSENAMAYAMSAIEIITDKLSDDDLYILLMACSQFTKCIPEADLPTFIGHLMEKIAAIPTLTMFIGVRLIAKQIGPVFAQFLPQIFPFLDEIAMTDVSILVDDPTQRRSEGDFSTVYFPGKFNLQLDSEQASEVSRALLSIGDYARAVGSEFMPYAEKAIQAAIHGFGNAYYDDIRTSSISLLSSLAKSNPPLIPKIFECILQPLLENTEPLASVKEEMMKTLKKIIRIAECPDEIRLQYLSSLPQLLNLAITSIRKETEEDEFNSEDSDHYLNLLWSIAKALKFLYEQQSTAQQAGATFVEISKQFSPFQEEPILLIKQFSMAVWIDFLIYGPQALVAECQPMIQQALEMVNDEDCECRRLALYGTGRIFENLEIPPDQIETLLAKLYEVCTSESAQENEDFYEGNDAGLSSYGILLKKRIPFGNATPAITHFLELFPAEDDMEEVKLAYSILLELLWESGSNQEISPLYSNICEKLVQGLSIESISSDIHELIDTKIQNGNVPPQVTQFLNALSQAEA